MALIARPMLERLIDRSDAPVMLTHDAIALALLGALGAAWITHRIGVHVVFGAFSGSRATAGARRCASPAHPARDRCVATPDRVLAIASALELPPLVLLEIATLDVT